ncbi:MAG: protein YgfX [Candidatus Thiodiazotropha sp.]
MSNDLPPLSIAPESSRLRTAWWSALYLSSAVAILSAGFSWVTELAILTLLFLSGVLTYRRSQLVSPHRVVRVTLTASGWCRLVMENGRQRKARLRGDSFVSPWVIVLRFDLPQRRGRPGLVVFRDALPGDQLRRLRIILGTIRFTKQSSSPEP